MEGDESMKAVRVLERRGGPRDKGQRAEGEAVIVQIATCLLRKSTVNIQASGCAFGRLGSMRRPCNANTRFAEDGLALCRDAAAMSDWFGESSGTEPRALFQSGTDWLWLALVWLVL